MPPRPQLDKLREAIAEDTKGFGKMARSLAKFGGLSREHGTLKRMPRGYADDHPAGDFLKLQSFTCGRKLTDTQVTGAKLADVVAREYEGMLPLVRWLNKALGYSS